jgi:hypothetical protein
MQALLCLNLWVDQLIGVWECMIERIEWKEIVIGTNFGLTWSIIELIQMGQLIGWETKLAQYMGFGT